MSKILHPFRDNAAITTSIDSKTLSDSEIPESLIITIDATHAGYKNRNCFYYDSDSMKYAVKQDIWTKPYPKPLLKNHDMESEPLGRVVKARFIDTDDGKGFTQLDVKVTDKEAIEKIVDGRYLTVSTSGVPMKDASSKFNFTLCSVCGTDLNRDDFCGHSRGRVYEDDDGVMKMCFWKVGAIEYKEVSIVNTPADNDGNTAAQITNIAMIDGEEEIDLSQIEDLQSKKSNVHIFADNEVSYAETTNFDKTQVANNDLWESVGKDKQKYIDNDGLVFNKEKEESKQNYDEEAGIYTDKDGKVWKTVDPSQLDKMIKDANEHKDQLLKETTPSWMAEDVKLTSSSKGAHNFPHYHAVYYDDELGNGSTDYILGHSHQVVDSKIKAGVVSNTGKVHSHKISKEKVLIGVEKKLLDKEDGHRHSVYLNEAGNGWASYVDGHAHIIVNGTAVEDSRRGVDELHTHSVVDWPDSAPEDIETEGMFTTIKDLEHLLNSKDTNDNIKEYLQKVLDNYDEYNNASEQVQVEKILDAIIKCS